MASRGTRLFQKRTLLLPCRCKSTRTTGAPAVETPPSNPSPQCPSTTALSGKTYGEVFRGWMVFKLLSFDWIVQKSLTMYGVSKKLLGVYLTKRLLKATIGGQFLGGFSEEEVKTVAETNASKKICSVWNYSIEQDLSDGRGDIQQQEARFDEIADRYLKSIQLSGEYNYQTCPVKMAAVKFTAIVDPRILSKLSGMLVAVRQSKQGNNGDACELSPEGEKRRAEIAKWMGSFHVSDHLSRLQEMSTSGGCSVAPFSDTEREQLGRFLGRLDDIGQCARREDVRVLVDAEESRVQPAIHHLTVYHMMTRFNHTQPYIYNTTQMYLKNSLEALLVDIAAAKSVGFSYGIKLVRGAYMVYEKDMAAQLGHECPVHASKEATDSNYDRGVRCLLEELARGESEAGVGGMLVASHNRDSVEKAVERMQELGVSCKTGAVCFGQLLGMADYLSNSLVDSGHFVQKFLAYGEHGDVIPFLVRRAQENDNASQNAQLERQIYAEELRRRHFF